MQGLDAGGRVPAAVALTGAPYGHHASTVDAETGRGGPGHRQPRSGSAPPAARATTGASARRRPRTGARARPRPPRRTGFPRTARRGTGPGAGPRVSAAASG
ncbi:hypothetical protein FEF34_27025 [Streptomyces marianii]|uniref:Uncharacterized protein n=1 Tax=Streptomyces marianii TaxID=1817406 RepID=A0A5R9E7W7_9ACTN|nr:hypothetical protein FEF34_27025 [Streptomyces marianii]